MKIVEQKLEQFKLNENEKEKFRKISKDIISHPEFQKRLDNKVSNLSITK